MMGSSHSCYIPSFVEFSPPVPEKKIFEGFLPYMGMVAIIGIILMIFIALYLKAYIQNLVKNGPVVSEKSIFKFSYINGLGPRSRNDLDLQYSHTFKNSISCLHLQTFRSQGAVRFEKSTVITFSHRTKLDLAVK